MNQLQEIMIVDDDDISNFITQKCLENSGTVGKISIFQESPVALKDLLVKKENNQQLPEYILLDINMPYLDGFDFLELCQSECLDGLNVIMYTTSLRQEDRKKALQYTAVKGYLEKPLRIDQLQAIVNG